MGNSFNFVNKIMGQAKNRGTFEERCAMAIVRNEAIETQLRGKEANPKLREFRIRHGTQRLATRLVMAGILAAMQGKR
jgi:soluble cytochrome b562